MQLPLEKLLIRYNGCIFNLAVHGDSEITLPIKEKHLQMYLNLAMNGRRIYGGVLVADFEELNDPTQIILIRSINFVDFFD